MAGQHLLIPKDIAARTKEVFGKEAQGSGPEAKYAANLIAKAGDKYFSRMGWFTRTHPQQLPSGRILVPMYSDGYSYGIMAISDDNGATWTASQPLVGNGPHSTVGGSQAGWNADRIYAR